MPYRKTFAKHLTSEGLSIFPIAYWVKVSEAGDFVHSYTNVAIFFLNLLQ